MLASGSFLSLRSPCRHDFSFLAPDFLKPDLLMLLQTVHCLDALVFPVGISCLGPVFPLSVAGSSLPGPPPPIHSLARSGSPLSIPDLLSMGSLIPLRCNARAGLTLLMSGLSCFGSVSSPPVASSTTLGPALLTRSPSHVSPVPFVLDSLDSGSSSASKSLACLGLSLSVSGKALLEAPALVSDFSSSGAPSFLHSVARPGLVLLVLDSLHLGSFTPLRCSSCSESLVLAFGLSRPGSVSLLSVVASTNLESSSTARTHAHLGFPPSALDFMNLGFFMLPRQLCRMGLTSLLLGLACLGFVFSPLVVSCSHLGPLASLRSSARFDLPAPAPRYGHTGLALSSRAVQRSGSISSISGLSRPGVLLLAPDPTHLESLLLIHSFVRIDFSPSLLDFLTLGFPLFSRSLA